MLESLSLMNELKFKKILVGTYLISYKYDIALSKEQYSKLKKSVPTEFLNNLSVIMICDNFKDYYYISILVNFEITPFQSDEDAENFMKDSTTFLLYSKNEMLAELVEIRRLLIVAGVEI